jgi:hypothetical protein
MPTPPTAPPSTTQTWQPDHFIAYALHRMRLHSSVTSALYLLQRLKAHFPAAEVLRLLSYLVFTCFAYASYLPYLYDRTVSTVYRTHFGLCRYLDT